MSLFDKIHKFFESLHTDEHCAHVVIRSGDTMSEIAEEFTGDGKRWHEAEALNPGKDLNKIKPGESYAIPKEWLD
jgi:nucleoid-associated protein YgaU